MQDFIYHYNGLYIYTYIYIGLEVIHVQFRTFVYPDHVAYYSRHVSRGGVVVCRMVYEHHNLT